MDGILGFFDWFSGVITDVWNFFTDFLTDIVLLFKYIANTATLLFTLILNLPPWLYAIANATVCVSILYMYIGRNTGGKSQ